MRTVSILDRVRSKTSDMRGPLISINYSLISMGKTLDE
jgi:hypothetical protein